MGQKLYRGIRGDADPLYPLARPGLRVVVTRLGEPNVPARDLNPRYDLRNHSPSGFECGYGGSGPAQLALAILADCLEDDRAAQRLYMELKDDLVCTLPQDRHWVLPEQLIRRWALGARVERLQRDEARAEDAAIEAAGAAGPESNDGLEIDAEDADTVG